MPIALLNRRALLSAAACPAFAFGAVHFETKTGAEILMHEWTNGVAEYRTVLIARRDGGIGSLQDLRGRTIAGEAAASLDTTRQMYPLVADVIG